MMPMERWEIRYENYIIERGDGEERGSSSGFKSSPLLELIGIEFGS